MFQAQKRGCLSTRSGHFSPPDLNSVCRPLPTRRLCYLGLNVRLTKVLPSSRSIIVISTLPFLPWNPVTVRPATVMSLLSDQPIPA